jgi:CubicO group peptidase (beta-lactamase class C family)
MTRCRVGTFRLDEVGDVAQPHMRQGDEKGGGNVVIRADEAVVPEITSAAAGGIRCSLNDMLQWIRLWLDPELKTPGGQPWLSPTQREALWTAQMPMKVSGLQRDWNDTHFLAYGYGWRLADVDGIRTVSHTGSLLGMYSALTLIPSKHAGFVLMTNGEGSAARAVLNEMLLKQFTAPAKPRSLSFYADALDHEDEQSPATDRAPDVPARVPAAPAQLGRWLGHYRDPWFGEVSICVSGERVRFAAAKSPLMSGTVMRASDRWLVDWDDASVDTEAWLDFRNGAADAATLAMSKVDSEADFSSDYEDLDFRRVRGCEMQQSGMQSDIDTIMDRYDGTGPGASVLVLHDGKPIVRRAYGFADLEKHVAATPETNYRLASVTKQFTSAAILLLVQDGKVHFDDRVRTWLPALPPAADAITIRHLLTHTSGLIDYEDVMPQGLTEQLHDADVLALLARQDRTYFAPGTSYRYSNGGYALLALIVERASGQSFARFLRQRIFLPLGMKHSVAYEQGISTVDHRAFGYSPDESDAEPDRWTRTDQSSTSAVLGDGGIYSSIDDLAKWDAALYDDRLLNAESRRLAFSPATPTDDPRVEYGFGWRITGETLWHSGETIGFRNVIVRYPARHLTVIVLTNRDDPEPYPAALRIAARVMAAP